MKRNLTVLALAIVSIVGNSIAMQQEEITPQEYVANHRIALLQDYLIATNQNPALASTTEIPNTTLYLWAAAKMGTPEAHEWYIDYRRNQPLIQPTIFTEEQKELESEAVTNKYHLLSGG